MPVTIKVSLSFNNIHATAKDLAKFYNEGYSRQWLDVSGTVTEGTMFAALIEFLPTYLESALEYAVDNLERAIEDNVRRSIDRLNQLVIEKSELVPAKYAVDYSSNEDDWKYCIIQNDKTRQMLDECGYFDNEEEAIAEAHELNIAHAEYIARKTNVESL